MAVLSVKPFPDELLSALKIKAIEMDMSLRDYVIQELSAIVLPDAKMSTKQRKGNN